MKEIDSGDARLCLLDEQIVLVETKPGVTLDKEKTRRLYALVEEQMPGDYSLVINRRHSYRLMRFEVYGVANSQPRLRGVAIVAYQKVAALMAEMEAPLCQKPFARFSTVDEAVAWAKSLHLR